MNNKRAVCRNCFKCVDDNTYYKCAATCNWHYLACGIVDNHFCAMGGWWVSPPGMMGSPYVVGLDEIINRNENILERSQNPDLFCSTVRVNHKEEEGENE